MQLSGTTPVETELIRELGSLKANSLSQFWLSPSSRISERSLLLRSSGGLPLFKRGVVMRLITKLEWFLLSVFSFLANTLFIFNF